MVFERQVACLYRLTAASRKVALDMSKPASARVGRQPMIGTRGFSTAAPLRKPIRWKHGFSKRGQLLCFLSMPVSVLDMCLHIRECTTHMNAYYTGEISRRCLDIRTHVYTVTIV